MWRQVFLLLLVGCGNQSSITKEKKKLTVSPELIDLGVLTVGDTATSEIDLTHVQGGDINVVTITTLNVAGSYLSADDSVLPVVTEDEPGVITVSYHPLEAGYHRAQVTITTNEEDDGKHVVELRGAAAFPSADVFPPILDFGPVLGGASADREVTLRNSGTVRLDLAGLAFNSPAFSSTQTATSLDGGEELVIPVRFSPGDVKAAEGAMSLDLGAAPPRSVELKGNNCSEGDASLYDVDQDNYTACSGDCDDTDKTAHPGGVETCDTVDNDCDGKVDEGTSCVDDDGDGLSEADGDCNDHEAGAFPGAIEDPTNGMDDDCDGIVDLGGQDYDSDGYGGKDCDDSDPTVFPGAAELVDNLDNDCDGAIDEGTTAFDDDGDGYSETAGDCDDTNIGMSPTGREQADGLDNDCDGVVDNGTSKHDDDGDGFTEEGGDCNDASGSVSPGVVETVGDGIDNNCDGLTK